MTKPIVLLGGSGIKEMSEFADRNWEFIHTGYKTAHGEGRVEFQQSNGVTFIPRHGHTIRYGPAATQYAANLIAAKMLGADIVIATSAVGSLKKGIGIESLVVPDDYVDESGRDDIIFKEGIVVHAMPRPAFSDDLRKILIRCAKKGEYGFNGIHKSGTYVTIPGDRFGTKAEGKRRSKYADIVGMTACPEASMALQLGLHYAVAAFPVDMDRDANHEGATKKVMKRMSREDRVPAYILSVIEQAKKLELGPLLQLKGNIIPCDTERIKNLDLRRIADGLIEMYC